jgi:hypothetical protein
LKHPAEAAHSSRNFEKSVSSPCATNANQSRIA